MKPFKTFTPAFTHTHPLIHTHTFYFYVWNYTEKKLAFYSITIIYRPRGNLLELYLSVWIYEHNTVDQKYVRLMKQVADHIEFSLRMKHDLVTNPYYLWLSFFVSKISGNIMQAYGCLRMLSSYLHISTGNRHFSRHSLRQTVPTNINTCTKLHILHTYMFS